MSKLKQLTGIATIALLTLPVLQPAAAVEVMVTPLGSMKGEFCQLDRALIFEDPDGTRLL